MAHEVLVSLSAKAAQNTCAFSFSITEKSYAPVSSAVELESEKPNLVQWSEVLR